MPGRIVAGLLLAALALAIAPAAQAGICPVQNLMPAFFAFETGTQTMTPEKRADLFVKDFVPRYPAFYDTDRFGDPAKTREAALHLFNHTVPQALSAYPPVTDAKLRAVAAAALPAFEKAQGDFVAAFPNFRCEAPVGFGPSLMRFDGNGYQDAQGIQHMRFGIDMIALLHSTDDLPVLFSHELFHLYHAQILKDDMPQNTDLTWWAMWEEGLATYVSGQLNPSKSEQQILWIPANLVARMEAPGMRQRAARLMLADFDESNGAQWFQFSHSAPGLPARAGYFMGLHMAEELGRDHSLSWLAHLEPDEVKQRARAFLMEQAALQDKEVRRR